MPLSCFVLLKTKEKINKQLIRPIRVHIVFWKKKINFPMFGWLNVLENIFSRKHAYKN